MGQSGKSHSMLPKTMKPAGGNYVEHPDIFEVHTNWLTIQTKSPSPMHADGEIQTEGMNNFEYSVVPECLPILLRDPY